MPPKAKKTAMCFHAKDDLPEIRREVFKMLVKHELRFFAIVRDKSKVLEYVRKRNEVDSAYRYNPNELYDSLVRQLFRDRLHQHDVYEIFFARKGKSDRTVALRTALEAARRRFSEKWGIISTATNQTNACYSRESTGLQAADYFLWALQRLYERDEARYLEYLRPSFRLVRDLDDTRRYRYGEYYTQKTRSCWRPKKIARDIGVSGLTQSSHGMKPNFVPGINNFTRLEKSVTKIVQPVMGVHEKGQRHSQE